MSFELREKPVEKQKRTEPEERKLTLVQDKTYDGNGVKILISNVPENAVVLTVLLTDVNRQVKQICFMKNTQYGENHEYFNLGYFIYPFLKAGTSYTFDFIYKLADDSDDYIEKASIKVVPEKGEELFIKTMDKDNLVMNPKTLTGYFKEKLISNIPQDAVVRISVWDSNWTYLGDMTRTLTEKDAYESYNLYNDKDYSYARKDLNSITDVIVNFSIIYECFSWQFFSSEKLPFSAERIYNPHQ